ncbi:hypothetical protein TUM19329_36030 (plasmid) [Legionella antarctica]|jgi:hypothetical protein|uniref:Antirestriction protein n=1 Tax=Legionella antarctica TaxID=2708020 RepID=A0A6F8TB72_9GAMM|nr:antirestriction protein [Legionella antarctica]BCA97242.1 hypothetical protein TUM19329_36030 [Legionella antarctica]
MKTARQQFLIQSQLVSDEQRLAFLPKHLNKEYLSFESSVYRVMDTICGNYNGGYWDFFELGNNGFYMAPHSSESFTIFVHGNGYEGSVSCDAAGIIATTYALNNLAWLTESEELIDKYYSLLDFARQHPEFRQIFAAID